MISKTNLVPINIPGIRPGYFFCTVRLRAYSNTKNPKSNNIHQMTEIGNVQKGYLMAPMYTTTGKKTQVSFAILNMYCNGKLSDNFFNVRDNTGRRVLVAHHLNNELIKRWIGNKFVWCKDDSIDNLVAVHEIENAQPYNRRKNHFEKKNDILYGKVKELVKKGYKLNTAALKVGANPSTMWNRMQNDNK